MSAIPQRWRGPLLAVAGILAVLAFSQILQSGGGFGVGHGTPPAILFLGLIYGLIAGLNSLGIVLIYRTTRILNLAQTSLGTAGAILFFELQTETPVPFPVNLLLGTLLAAALGLTFDFVFGRRFANAPRLVLTLFTIFAAEAIATLSSQAVATLPFLPPFESRGLTNLQPNIVQQYLPFAGWHFTIGGLGFQFGFPHLFALAASLASLAALWAFLYRSRWGVALRAMAGNPERAALLGISVGGLGTIAWVISGTLSGISLTLDGMVRAPQATATVFATDVLIAALAAAVIARMESLVGAMVAAIGLSVLTETISYQLPSQVPLVSVVVFAAILLGLLRHRRLTARSETGAAAQWELTQEVRPVPKELSALPIVRILRIALPVLVVLAAIAYPLVVSPQLTSVGGAVLIFAIAGVSMVMLTGWAGQASAGQFALVAVGAVVAAAIATKLGLTFWLAVPIATVITAGVAVLIGLPALRIQGLFLLVATLAFAQMVRNVLFDTTYFGWLLPTQDIRRPSLFLIDFDNERNMYYLVLAALVLTIVVVVNLRRSRFGRLVIAVRENDANAASAGVNPVRMRILAFAAAGAVAGFAGAIFAFDQQVISPDSYAPLASINVLQQVVVGGAGSIAGPLMGSVFFFALNQTLGQNATFVAIVTGTAPLVILYLAPGGFVSVLARMRDAVLRIVAQRNNLIVPSLFADIDPEALSRRLIPLAPAAVGSGLQALSRAYLPDRSRLYPTTFVPLGRQRDSETVVAAARRADEALEAATP